jgi:predicted dehydrogenase
LLALLLYHLEVGRTVAIIANAQIALVVLVVALLFVDRLIATYRWFSLLRGLAPAICVIVRAGLTYGRGRSILPHLGSVVADRFIALGDQHLLLPLVHIDSLTDALVRVAMAPAAAGRTYQVVDENGTTRGDYLRTLNELSGHGYRALYVPLRAGTLVADGLAVARRVTGISRIPELSAEKLRMRGVEARYETRRLREDTGWSPLVPLREGLAQSLGVTIDGRATPIERVGIIGAGRVAPFHLEALRRLPGVRVTGILDLDADAARTIAAGHGGLPHFSDTDRFYREAAPQLVHVLTPPSSHAKVALDALGRGVHVLLEKPAVRTVEECDRLDDAARAANVTVGVDENFVFAPRLRQALARIARGDLGDLVHISTFFGFDFARARAAGADARPWFADLPGGLLEDLLPHPLTVTLALAGRNLPLDHWSIRSSGRLDLDGADEVRLTLGDQELTADLAMSLTCRPDDFVVTVYGTRATLRVDLQNMLLDVARFGPGPRAVARAARVLNSGVGMISQTFGNAFGILTRRALPPGTPVHLIRAHYAALAAGHGPPAPLSRARHVVACSRTIWPSTAAREADEPRRLATTGP